MTTREAALRTIDTESLTPIVRTILGTATACVTAWKHEPCGLAPDGIHGTAPSTYRFSGRADAAGREASWSCVLKIVTAPETPADPASPANGAREPLAYRSGLLSAIRGVRAPRCFGVDDRPEGGWWLWLENAGDEIGRHWPRDRYLLAARHLGHFNAASPSGDRSPQPWLSRSPLRDAAAELAPDVARLREARQPPLVRQAITPAAARALLRIAGTIEDRLAALDRLPQLLCHWDAHRANLTSSTGDRGTIETIALDWANLGWGPAGAELSQLLAKTVDVLRLRPDELPALDAGLFAHYVDGLRDGGWQGEIADVRFGHAASASARLLARTASVVHLASNDRARAGYERAAGQSFGVLADGFKATLPYYLSLAEEAASLSGS